MKPRFSLHSLLSAVFFIAIALASLLQPWRSWCPAAVLTGLLLLLLLSIPASIYARGRDRAFYLGFAVVGWGYFILAYAPGFESGVGRQLLARPVAEEVCFAITGSLGDIPHFLKVTHLLFMFSLAGVGGLVARRCHLKAAVPAATEHRISADQPNCEGRPLDSKELSLRRAQ